ncbi:MAG: 4Fe-4S dicluster domain-containing protein [Candidatus Bathyarchaeota archaeon]|nr:MAG: 4Fe-4S dicluster domain-containing protein [Candidatus Bathyarchaeota archaeon]
MEEIDIYEKLRRKVSLWPIKVPRIKEALELFKILFTEEEAKFLAHFTAPYQDSETFDQIVEKTGKSRKEVKLLVDSLVSKGLLFKYTRKKDGQVHYSLLPMAPGIFEFYFASGPDSDKKRKVAKLMEKAYLNGYGMEVGASEYPWARVIPIEKTITINKDIPADFVILPFEQMSQFIKTARKIAVINCACRTKKACDHPLETCLIFDYSAEFMVERGYGRYLSIEEALELLEKSEKAGLIHSTLNAQTRPTFICNCCTCACLILRGLSELHNPRAIARANFIPERNEELCNKCRNCVRICPMKANVYHAPHDNEPERILFLEERCLGCGLCAYHCPKTAINLVKVKDQVPEMTPREAMMRVESERVH